MDESPLAFSFDIALDFALSKGWTTWFQVAQQKGVERTTEWLLRRDGVELDPADAQSLVETVLQSSTPFERAMAASELAELTELEDDAMAAVLWEGVMVSGREASDSEVYFEGLSQLAEIETEYGDPQAAALLYIDFLNWAREARQPIEAETILTAFDHIVLLAESDSAPLAAAEFGHAQTRFFRSIDGDDRRIVSQDWEADHPPFAVWTD